MLYGRLGEQVLMLTVYFLNVGHGECTLIEHPSGRLTMVDINTSHEYDWNTRQEIAANNSKGLAAAANPQLLRGVAPPGNPPTGLSALLSSNPSPTLLGGAGLGNPLTGLAGLLGPTPALLKEGAADAAAKSELTDPIKFLQSRYPNRSLFRFISHSP